MRRLLLAFARGRSSPVGGGGRCHGCVGRRRNHPRVIKTGTEGIPGVQVNVSNEEGFVENAFTNERAAGGWKFPTPGPTP